MVDENPLTEYFGQSTKQLIALASETEVSAIVWAFEEALHNKSKPNFEERVILAVVALEREVTNGGFHQFFFNSSSQYAHLVVQALKAIECPCTAELSQQAISTLGIPINATPLEIQHLATDSYDRVEEKLYELDKEFYRINSWNSGKEIGEPLFEKLFTYIVKNEAKIVLSAF